MKRTSQIAFVAITFFAQSALAGVLTFSDFSTTVGLQLNGTSATLNNGIDAAPVLRLASAAPGQGGTAFTTSVMGISSFSTHFTFRLTNPGGAFDGTGVGADGFTFTIHNDAAGAGALGAIGGSLAYGGISPSVAVEWDTWNNGFDPDSNHVGINVNGSLASVGSAGVVPDFDNGALWHGWVDYDGTTLEVRTNMTGIRPAAALLSAAIDIPTTLGAGSGYLGFTAATGAAFANHDIVSWTFTSVPEPTTFALLGLGLAGLLGRRRR